MQSKPWCIDYYNVTGVKFLLIWTYFYLKLHDQELAINIYFR